MPSAAADAARLREALARLTRRLRAGRPADGPSPAGLGVLSRLKRDGATTPTALAQQAGVRLQSLTRLVAELEAEGWIERRADPQDGRQSWLALTASGSRRLQVETRRREAVLAAAIGRIDTADRAGLAEACRLLERLADALDAAEPA